LEWATANGSKFKVLTDEIGIYEFTFESEEFPLPIFRTLASQHRNLDLDVSWKDDQPHSIANNARIRGGVLNLSVATGDPREWPSHHFCFGGCPECGRANIYLNIKKDNWFYCDEHKKCWPAGTLFSSWKTENDEIWRENAKRIADYEIVRPYMGQQPVPMKFLRKLDDPDFALEVSDTAEAASLRFEVDEASDDSLKSVSIIFETDEDNEDVRYFRELAGGEAENVDGDKRAADKCWNCIRCARRRSYASTGLKFCGPPCRVPRYCADAKGDTEPDE
jgi:hypothetical protein